MTRRDLFKFLPAGLGSFLFTGGDGTDKSVEEAIKMVIRIKPPEEHKELGFGLNGLEYRIFTTTNFLIPMDGGFELNVYCEYLKVCATVTKIDKKNINNSKVMRFESPPFHKMDITHNWAKHVDNIIRKSQAISLVEYGPISEIPPLTQIT